MKIVECPRDALQGLERFVPTELKIEYLNALLAVGFDALDFGSFVSEKAVPQMRDTAEVLQSLDPSPTPLLCIVVNEKGLETALSYERIAYVGYPFSLSPTFQYRNSKKTPEESWPLVERTIRLTHEAGKRSVIYVSMGFGNPYGDAWDARQTIETVRKICDLGADVVAPADTAACARPEDVREIFSALATINAEIGAHFHVSPQNAKTMLEAAWNGGCRRFDCALMGFGGCPFAQDRLVGNLATETLLDFLESKAAAPPRLDRDALNRAFGIARRVFADEYELQR
ncbi:MAG: hydroxymethylglutaryl-CoA lyase [Bacteroidia bacterium]|nr:hydroxymethylglutaryl-CoA lyase [Bacteroidia bacterium]